MSTGLLKKDTNAKIYQFSKIKRIFSEVTLLSYSPLYDAFMQHYVQALLSVQRYCNVFFVSDPIFKKIFSNIYLEAPFGSYWPIDLIGDKSSYLICNIYNSVKIDTDKITTGHQYSSI